MRRSTDIEDQRWRTQTVVGLVLFTASLVGGQLFSTNNLRNDIAAARNESTAAINALVLRLDAQKEQAATAAAADNKVLDSRLSLIDKRLDEIERQYKLEDYDILSR